MRTNLQNVCGISVCNPCNLDEDYLRFTLNYAIEHGFNHLQIIGPIHNPIRGNVDGMVKLRKYARFNDEKDTAYIEKCFSIVNEICEKAKKHGIRTYMWHHELDLPTEFGSAYPEVLNSFGDIEVSHPLVKDFLEHKIKDFFAEYPNMDGIILTLHETKIPILKLKDQKLNPNERLLYVIKTLFDACKECGKELVVRSFASMEEDCKKMAKACREISEDLIVMDKWTQFDWSLTMPHNPFLKTIKESPLLIETDIFGEYFGKGWLPIMLKEHIAEKLAYCNSCSPLGYVSRIDRAGEHPFGDVNEVNLIIMNAHLSNKNVEEEVQRFFNGKYGDSVGAEIYSIMSETEELHKKIFYINGYYFHQQSFFPQVNHSKNHFYFEMMRKEHHLASGEWFIPKNWMRGSLTSLQQTKADAVEQSLSLLSRIQALQDVLSEDNYNKLHQKFLNLVFAARLWKELLNVFIFYVSYFEENISENMLYATLENLIAIDSEGKALLGEDFYGICGWRMDAREHGEKNSAKAPIERVTNFVQAIKECFKIEKETFTSIQSLYAYDYVICGGGTEGHSIQKEVNFSDTLIHNNKLCRIAGSLLGADFTRVNAHGWFGYTLKIRPNSKNTIRIHLGSLSTQIDLFIRYGDQKQKVHFNKQEEEMTLTYNETKNEDTLYIEFSRISSHTPCVYSIIVE